MATSFTSLEEFYAKLRTRIEKNVRSKTAFDSGECWEWAGCKKAPDGKYGRTSITFMGVSQTLGAHRAAYIAYHRELNLHSDVSHICHEGLCVNPKHLSHEDRAINLERSRCRENKKCMGHAFDGHVFKSCIIIVKGIKATFFDSQF